MDAHREKRIEEIFVRCIELPEGERAAFLESECAGDSALLEEVRKLLRHHTDTGTFLNRPAMPGDVLARTEALTGGKPLAAGRKIGSFEIIEVLGRGGMGVVYRARQDHPNRIVALKVIRPGFLSPDLLRRFEHEVEMLGRLQHPGIARVFEAGKFETEGGSEPWFAMELVEGIPLHDFAARNNLGTRDRLRLLAEAARAVHHAHERGVVHRDLKPENIMVDPSGRPRVLDFGIAKATDSDVQLTTLHTDVGQIVGTLPYMSPEQLKPTPAGLDTRVDIYALGVVAYQLLAGKLPFVLQGKSIIEAAQVIVNETPPPLSSADRTLRGDVEVLVGKAMAKEPGRRYASAAEFADDIERYLTNQPIAARPPTAAYQLRKLVARHRGIAVSVGALFVVITGFAAWMTVLYADASRLKDRAEKENQTAEAVTGFLGEMLSSADPLESETNELSVRAVLDRASGRLNDSFETQPLVSAALHTTVGKSYRSLGRLAEADSHLTRSLELYRANAAGGSEEYAGALDDLAQLRRRQGDMDGAIAMSREALALREKTPAAVKPLAESMNNLAILLSETGGEAESDSLYRSCIALCRRSPAIEEMHLSGVLSNYGNLKVDIGEMAVAETLLAEALAIDRRVLAPGHANLATSLNNYGLALHRQGRRAEAEPIYREALEIHRKTVGNESDLVSGDLNNLASLLREENRLDEAEPMAREAVAIERKLSGGSGWALGVLLGNLGEVVDARGNTSEAESILREAIPILRSTIGDDHRRTGSARAALGRVLMKQDRFAEAETELRAAYENLTKSMGPDHERTTKCREALVQLYERWGRPEKGKEFASRSSPAMP